MKRILIIAALIIAFAGYIVWDNVLDKKVPQIVIGKPTIPKVVSRKPTSTSNTKIKSVETNKTSEITPDGKEIEKLVITEKENTYISEGEKQTVVESLNNTIEAYITTEGYEALTMIRASENLRVGVGAEISRDCGMQKIKVRSEYELTPNIIVCGEAGYDIYNKSIKGKIGLQVRF